jgi:ABC-type microcin C transport system permease subunit YejB
MKKGISLIVLVITIIVIIILAGAVILSLASNNPIAQASEAVQKQDKVSVQAAINMLLAKEMATEREVAVITPGSLNGASPVARYTIGGVEKQFVFGTGDGTVGIALPTYAATWSIDVNGIVSLTLE